MILGIDEAGRGPWAGPLVVGAVVLGDAQIDGLTDSKKLTKKRREVLEVEVLEKALATGLGWVSSEEIDVIGLGPALRLATIRAVKEVDSSGVSYDEIIIDGTINFLSETGKGRFVETMPKADLLVPAVSAASIIAKVARDRYMESLEADYPGYGFGSHAGYGTAKHRQAIDDLGVTPFHRLSFAPLKKYADAKLSARGEPSSLSSGVAANKEDPAASKTTKEIGDEAESGVCDYLVSRGHKIIERNWKTRYCEVDIISICSGVTYFTEVKYRKNGDFGGGVSAVNQGKLEQMRFAAEMYLAQVAATKSVVSDQSFLAVAVVDGSSESRIDWFKID